MVFLNSPKSLQVPTLTLSLMLTLLLVGSLNGQETSDHRIWASVGLGAGWGRLHCDICEGGRDFGPAGYVSVGGLFGKHLAIGAELGGWRESNDSLNLTQRFITISAVAYWYPAPDSKRYFLKGGLGAVTYKADDIRTEEDDDAEPLESSAIGAQIGAGYKFFITRAITLSPYVTFTGSFKADLTRGNTTITSVSLTLIQFGLAVGWH
ncbi:MAG: outer membrane beta-barrel protein [Gemmatimonadota bacterium]|nr:MAG: outer membrane beta-barrel protein [Gemmatimonadota bacterium]